MTSTREQGQLAEYQAEKYLIHQGLRLIERNYQHHRGEIDLIMQDTAHLVFVEVRMRMNQNYAQSLESISQAKQTLIIRTANYYLLEHHQFNKLPCRFDVIGLNKDNEILWIQNAFQVQYT